jgi:hypothetical protein
VDSQTSGNIDRLFKMNFSVGEDNPKIVKLGVPMDAVRASVPHECKLPRRSPGENPTHE